MRNRRNPGWLTTSGASESSEPGDTPDGFDDLDDLDGAAGAAGASDDDDLSITRLAPADASPWSERLASLAPRLHALWRLSGGLALAALVATVVIALEPHLLRPAPTRPQIPYTTLAASSDVARCLNGVVWSPDSRQVAAVQSPNCSAPYLGPASMKANLAIFDAATGRQVATYTLDDAVNAALARRGLTSRDVAYTISYHEANWSADARSIAVGFTVYGDEMDDTGVAVVILSGAERGHVSVAVGGPGVFQPMPANGFDLIPVTRWDLTRGDQTTIYLTPALRYRWLPSDVLIADEPLPANASAPAPSVTDAGSASSDGQSFSMWQSATVVPVTALACAPSGGIAAPLSQPYAAITLVASAWSPDGRYLLDAMVQARLPAAPGHLAPPAAATNLCDDGLAPDQLPSAPLHDKALAAALRLLDPQGDNQLTLAWSRDGHRLAVVSLDIAPKSGKTVIYDSASGATLATYSGADFAATNGGVYSAQNPIWSPDGHSLLLTISGPFAKLIILGPRALGS